MARSGADCGHCLSYATQQMSVSFWPITDSQKIYTVVCTR
jgi:molybdate-binding protein